MSAAGPCKPLWAWTHLHLQSAQQTQDIQLIQPDTGLQDGMRTEYTCTCSVLEIYNEVITDLLVGSGDPLSLHQWPQSSEVYVEGLHDEVVHTGELSS